LSQNCILFTFSMLPSMGPNQNYAKHPVPLNYNRKSNGFYTAAIGTSGLHNKHITMISDTSNV
jgi:hypothetical protein